jgi:predicted dehydrogenase
MAASAWFFRWKEIAIMKRVLVIGVGSIGERHLRCFQMTGRAEVSICEKNETLRSTVAANYDVRHAYANLDAGLSDPHDAVVICTPAQLHIPLAQQCAEANLHLLIEKPLAIRPDGVDKLRQIVSQRGLACAVAYVTRMHPALSAMKRAIDAGRFGPPVQFVACGGQHFPKYRPAYREIYYADHAQGGGAIQDALTHTLNAGQWLVGNIDRVAADAAHQVLEGVSVEDTAHVLARHGRVIGSYTLNQYQAANESTITVICQGATVRYEGHHVRWRWLVEPDGDWEGEVFPKLAQDDLFVAQANHFLDVIEGREPPHCSLDEGLATLKAVMAIQRAVTTGRWESVQ